jgi:hypothetical protein
MVQEVALAAGVQARLDRRLNTEQAAVLVEHNPLVVPGVPLVLMAVPVEMDLNIKEARV